MEPGPSADIHTRTTVARSPSSPKLTFSMRQVRGECIRKCHSVQSDCVTGGIIKVGEDEEDNGDDDGGGGGGDGSNSFSEECAKSSSDLFTSSSTCSSMPSSQSTSPTPLPTVNRRTFVQSITMLSGSTAPVKQRRYRLTKRRTMPPRSNSTPLTPDSPPGDSSIPTTPLTTPIVQTSCDTPSFSGRVSRFVYSDSLQKRLVQSFLRQNSVDDVIQCDTKKKKSMPVKCPSYGDCDDLDISRISATPPISPHKRSKLLSLSHYKSNSLPSVGKEGKVNSEDLVKSVETKLQQCTLTELTNQAHRIPTIIVDEVDNDDGNQLER